MSPEKQVLRGGFKSKSFKWEIQETVDRECGHDAQADRAACKGRRNTQKNCLTQEVRQLGVYQPLVKTAVVGGGQGVHSLALEPVSSRLPAVSQPTKETFRQVVQVLADGSPPSLKTVRSRVWMGP